MPTTNPSRGPAKAVVQRLVRVFSGRGYLRRQNKRRMAKEGTNQYKKGEEVRLIADTRSELAEIRKLLVQAGFKPGKPFRKGAKYCQPVYGKEAVGRFLTLVGGKNKRAPSRRK
ncbi:MAG: hypothetical protein K6T86_18425 [Pirellulales bacterium]|nr:hypothetical protein [Pirellulales bacterium]